MSQEVYLSLELDHDRLGAVLGPDSEEQGMGSFLDYLADATTQTQAEAAELEAFLRQRQSHVLGRADRL